MSFDFNKQGVQYSCVAVRGSREDYGILSPRPFALLEQLRASQAAEYPKADSTRQRWLLDAAGCLDRLGAFLLQVSRVAQHAYGLTQNPLPDQPMDIQPEPGQMVILAANKACFDFESLLFHARAALDRITWFVAARHGQRSDRYSKLRNILANFSMTDDRARQMVSLLGTANRFGGLLVDKDDAKALRAIVAHRSSVPESRQIAFTVHFLPENRRLIFDCEALGQPLLATAEQLATDVPFVVLNSVALYMGIELVPHGEFEPTWTNPTTVFSRHLDSSGSGPVFSVGSVYPSGVTVKNHALMPRVLERAVTCGPPVPGPAEK